MKQKGFTLIELLAVIIVLAVIALIVVPIISTVIRNARRETNERSIQMYATAIKNAISSYQLLENSIPTEFSQIDDYISYNGDDVECATIKLNNDGTVYLANCTVNDKVVDYTYGIKPPVCSLEDLDSNGEASLSDIVTCGSERFYVMKNENNEITMLSMYNLNVGNSAYTGGSLGIQNENVFGLKTGAKLYGALAFSKSGYWNASNYPAWIYNDNSNLYYDVSEYESFLRVAIGVSPVSATLMSYEQLVDLQCSRSSVSCSNAPAWVYSTSYWTGSANGAEYVWVVLSDGSFYTAKYSDAYYGVRPVITISTLDISK